MRITPVSAGLCAAVLLNLGVSTAHGTPISPFRQVVVQNCITPPCGSTVTDGSPLTVNQTLTAADGSTLVSNAGGVATFGLLGARGSIELDRKTLGTAFSFVEASFTDVLTVDFASLTGAIGFLAVSYTLDGTIAKSGVVNAEAEVRTLVDRDGFGTGLLPQQSRIVRDSSASGPLLVPQLFTFTYGEPFNFSATLDLALGTASLGSGTPISLTSPVVGSGAGVADFENTLKIANFAVFDPSMAPLSGARVLADSGTTYSVAAVPEPATLSLLSFGIALACLASRQRRG